MPVSPQLSARALATLLPDLRDQPPPVYAALANAVIRLVLDGRVAVGVRLPSERGLASTLQISRATVTSGYDQLRQLGYLASRTGAGSFTTLPAGARPSTSLVRWSPATTPADDIDLSAAALPAPAEQLTAALTKAAQLLPQVVTETGYDPVGLPMLRTAIAARFTERGVPTAPDQILVTNGSLHALDLLLRLLVAPGDRVLTELPSYPGALDAIRANQARIVPAPVSADHGWDVPQLEGTLRQTAPRIAYLIPDFQNPTGYLVPDADRRAVLRAARATGTAVVADESFVELGYDGARATPMAALDPAVITIGSISKPVWGGIRIGWVRADPDLVRRLAIQRAAIDMSGSALDQVVGALLFTQLPELAAARQAELRPRRDGLVAALAEHFPHWHVPVPTGGLSVWVELDAPLATPLTTAVAQLGVRLVPGSRFGVDGTLERYLRLPFALPLERLEEAVRRLATAWERLDRGATDRRPLVVA